MIVLWQQLFCYFKTSYDYVQLRQYKFYNSKTNVVFMRWMSQLQIGNLIALSISLTTTMLDSSRGILLSKNFYWVFTTQGVPFLMTIFVTKSSIRRHETMRWQMDKTFPRTSASRLGVTNVWKEYIKKIVGGNYCRRLNCWHWEKYYEVFEKILINEKNSLFGYQTFNEI